EAFLDERVLQRADRALDELRAVVGGDDLHTLGEAPLQPLELVLDAPDDLEGVFPMAGDDDGADDLALAIQLAQTAADFRPDLNRADVGDADGRAVLVGLDGDGLDVGDALEIAAPADEVFAPAHLDDPAGAV